MKLDPNIHQVKYINLHMALKFISNLQLPNSRMQLLRISQMLRPLKCVFVLKHNDFIEFCQWTKAEVVIYDVYQQLDPIHYLNVISDPLCPFHMVSINKSMSTVKCDGAIYHTCYDR